jgi:hypothetical protein
LEESFQGLLVIKIQSAQAVGLPSQGHANVALLKTVPVVGITHFLSILFLPFLVRWSFGTEPAWYEKNILSQQVGELIYDARFMGFIEARAAGKCQKVGIGGPGLILGCPTEKAVLFSCEHLKLSVCFNLSAATIIVCMA